MRAFIGISLNDCLEDLMNIQKKYIKSNINANYTSQENIHITLSFLGDINNDQVQDVKRILNNINLSSFKLVINKVKKLKDMLVLEVEENDRLISLQNEIEAELIKNDFQLEKRKFYPHITLIRRYNPDVNEDIHLEALIRDITLYSSERINNILKYIPQISVKLCED